MPSFGEWIESPLDIVHRLYGEFNSEYISKLNEFYSSLLADQDNINKIPSLNNVPLYMVKANSLVRFRCIIQDMFEPEIYLSEYETVNKNSGQCFMRCGRYKDVAECHNEEDVKCTSRRNVMKDRYIYYCVPIPAETLWVKKGFSSTTHLEPRPSTSGENQSRDSHKRTHDDNFCPGSPDSVISSTCSTLNEDSDLTETEEHMETADSTGREARKRTKVNNTEASKTRIPVAPNLNFPLSSEVGPACIVKVIGQTINTAILQTLLVTGEKVLNMVKIIHVLRVVYEQEGEPLKVTEMIEFIGVLSIDPALSTFRIHDDDDPMHLPSVMQDEAEMLAHSPPPSLVPRLHCISTRRLHHNNPLVARDYRPGFPDKASARLLCEAKDIRSELVSVLEQMLFGDVIAAEYLLCHLISNVYARRDVLALGKFSLNVSGCSANWQLAEYLTRLFETLLTKVHFLPLSLAHMNECLLSPKKDYSANRLVAGALQMSDNTQLVVDETALQAGQLNDTGVKNVAAIGNLIQWQKVEYDMTYHKSDFMANMQVLVISEGKSLLPTDCRIHLVAGGDTTTIRERYNAVTQYLTPVLRDRIRTYITVLQNADYTISEQMQKVLEHHFVESRKDDAKKMTHEDFNVLLVLTRLLSLSYGETTLSLDVWNRTKELEKERQRRLL